MAFGVSTIRESADLPDTVRREVPRVMNRLLGSTVLYQGDEVDKEDYYLVHRYRDIFAALFSLAGFTLLHDDYHHIFQAVSDFGYCRRRYKLDESLHPFILIAVWCTGQIEASISRDCTACPSRSKGGPNQPA